jgi:hypothetical protein
VVDLTSKLPETKSRTDRISRRPFRRKNIYGNLFGTKCPNVTISHRDAVAVESLKYWHDDPSAAAHFLAQLTNRRRSVLPDALADQFTHALQTLRSHHDFSIDLDGFAGIDQELPIQFRGNTRSTGSRGLPISRGAGVSARTRVRAAFKLSRLRPGTTEVGTTGASKKGVSRNLS